MIVINTLLGLNQSRGRFKQLGKVGAGSRIQADISAPAHSNSRLCLQSLVDNGETGAASGIIVSQSTGRASS